MAFGVMTIHTAPFAGSVKSTKCAKRVTVKCQAKAGAITVARRSIAAGIVAFPAIAAPYAKAILLDEDDEEMIERAKANRKARLASQRDTTREFMKAEGLTNRELDQQLAPVQKAVYKLAKSGSELDSGDIGAAAATLSESWVDEFKQATELFPSASSSAETVIAGLTSLKDSASGSDLTASKQQFIALVTAVESWATDAGVMNSLKGL